MNEQIIEQKSEKMSEQIIAHMNEQIKNKWVN